MIELRMCVSPSPLSSLSLPRSYPPQVRHAAMPDRLWTLAQSETLTDYIDKCWMYPDQVRESWIDALGLKIVKDIPKGYFLNATGINESSHAHWTKVIMKSEVNRLPSEVVVNTNGITADGEVAIGGGFFRDAQTRWSDAAGRPLPQTTDRLVRHAKACLAFLTIESTSIYPHPLPALSIEEFKAARIAAAAGGAHEGEDESRTWRRHRRDSGGRMSSSFHQLQLRPPDDGELRALVISACMTIHQQQRAAMQVPEAGVSDLRRFLEPELGDLSSRCTCINDALTEYACCSRARSAGCTLVPSLPNDSIRRHAEAAATRRAARGLSPEFPSELQRMLELLKHGGPLSFSKDGFMSVHNATGRCQCLDSTWHGVLSAPLTGNADDLDGACKHDQLRLLHEEASASAEAALAVRERCAAFLCDYIYERERTRGSIRCMPLYISAQAQDIDALLVALQSHPSLPPSGTGVAAGAGPSTEPDSDESDCDGLCDRCVDDEAMQAADNLQQLPRRRAIFQANELARNGFGIAFASNDDLHGGMGIVVVAFIALHSGGHGPAAHTGEQLQPRDIVLSLDGGDGDLAKLLSSDAQLRTPPGSATLEFVRPAIATGVSLGGRPAQTKPKHGPNAKGKGKASAQASAVRDAELLGGAPARAPRKPQRARARDGTGADPGEPTPDEQIEAAFRAVETAGGDARQQQEEMESIANEVEARLLARRELSEVERTARDAELETMVYSQ